MFNYGNNKKPTSTNFTPFLPKGLYLNVVVTKVEVKKHKLAPDTKVAITVDVGGGELYMRLLSDARRYDALEFGHITKQVLNLTSAPTEVDAQTAIDALTGTVWDIEYDDCGCLWTLQTPPARDEEESA